jgi:hypothetical protein
MVHKNDYTVIAFYSDKNPLKWRFVHSIRSIVPLLNKHGAWAYFNVYDRRTGKYLRRFYPSNVISTFL